MAVACADAFLTAQALDITLDHPKNYRRILSDLKSRRPLDVKLSTWPILLFGRALARVDFGIDDLLAAKARRNSLLHGIGDQALAEDGDHPIGLGLNVQIHQLDLSEAERALGACVWLVNAILRARGMTNAGSSKCAACGWGSGGRPESGALAARAPHGDRIHAQGWLTNTDGHALPTFAADTNT